MSEIGDWLRREAKMWDETPAATGAVLCWNFGDKIDLGCAGKDQPKDQATHLLEGLSMAITEKYGE